MNLKNRGQDYFSVLVFKSEIDGLLMPDKHFVVQQQAARLPMDSLIDKAEAAFPEYVVGSWELFNNTTADRLYLVKRDTDDWYKLHLDQYTGEVLSEPVSTTHYFTDWFLETELQCHHSRSQLASLWS